MHLPDVPESTRAAFLFPIENHRWLVALAGMHGVIPPRNLEGFLAFAKTLRTPTLYDAIKGAHLVGNIARYRFPSSVRRRFDKLESFPRGLFPIGNFDLPIQPNLRAGDERGRSGSRGARASSRKQAREFRPVGRSLIGVSNQHPGAAESPWAIAETDFAYEQTRGTRPPDLARRLRRAAALVQLAAHDEAAHKLVFEVRSLLKPHSALRGPWLEARLMAAMESVGYT